MRGYRWLMVCGCLSGQLALPSPAALARPPAPLPQKAGPAPVGPAATPVAATQVTKPEAHILLAAGLLEQNKPEEASVQLAKYVAVRPENLVARAQLAELHLRLKKLEEARLQFMLVAAQAQEHGDDGYPYLLHSYSRLVEVAEGQDDAYHEHLNRGIGLWLLACRRRTEPSPEEAPSATSLFCRAASELQAAREARPHEPRPHLYLYQVWSQLGQATAAQRCLRAADQRALAAPLTPFERRQLKAACLTILDFRF